MRPASIPLNRAVSVHLGKIVRHCLPILVLVVLATDARAGAANVRIMMDWVIGSTHAPFFIAQDKGYFKASGVTVDGIDPGTGATNVAVTVAGGAYQFGWVDLPSMIRFNAQNPADPLIAVYMSFDETPSCIVTLRSKGIKTPKDLDGKRLAGGPGTAVRDTISVLLQAAGAQDVRIAWVSVSPQLFAPMLVRGEVDGIGAFDNAQVPALIGLGLKREEIGILKYSDFGADLYGLALVTTKKFADENPSTVRGVVSALNAGTKDAIAAPEAALALMARRDPMLNLAAERVRLEIALEHTNTAYVAGHGLSAVTPERLRKTIDSIVSAYKLPTSPAPDAVYTDRFLPAQAERMPPKAGK
ncbi:MAG TPA: ABC transporter substrate-binding protein [Xanthobacteraceae bacterium]|jgi:NitT/TauT family transport system substrate-binding protein